MSGSCGLFCYSRSFPRHFCIWYIWCHILKNLLYNNCLCIVIVLIFLAVQCHSHMEHFFLLYSSTLNLSIFLVFTPRVTAGILLSLMTVFSPRGFGFSSTAIFFFSSFYYTLCHLVTVFMSCLLFSLTVNNLFFILRLHRCVSISFLNANFSCHLCWWRFLFSPDYRSSADAVRSSAQSWALQCCRCDLSLWAICITWMSQFASEDAGPGLSFIYTICSFLWQRGYIGITLTQTNITYLCTATHLRLPDTCDWILLINIK